ncbi:MAG TPA: type IV secretion system DNA-binding domain-containing protein [Verrucomicrobiae bacterium]|nr:type IV secretion system DNA-binding domain-containing protein [Verrucomicrobiae bacterium]
MPSVHEILTEQFRQWEVRGRGWRVFDGPVRPEPPFRPFDGHYLPDTPAVDDGKRPTFLSSLVRKASQRLANTPEAPPVIQTDDEPEPEPLFREPLVELQTALPIRLNTRPEEFGQFLSSVALCREPIAFELLGTPPHVSAQFAVHPGDAKLVHRQLAAHFPDVVFTPRDSTLEALWQAEDDTKTGVIEFGLANEFMIPLGTPDVDPFVGIIAALGELQVGELALYQVIFEAVRNPWAESVVRAVTHSDGKPFFVNAPELVKEAENKVSHRLYAAIVRIAARSTDMDRVWSIVREAASALGVFAKPGGNELIPLHNDEYPYDEHVEDMLRRQSRRTGMLLNSDELTGFVHLPSADVRTPALLRQTVKTKAAPRVVMAGDGLLLGHNTHAGQTVEVRLSPEQRVRHTHIIGASGTGKSTLLYNSICQNIQNGEGVAVLDPHGDLIDKILGVIPQERTEDVVLVDPSDEEYAVGFNILSAHSDLEKNLLASDLVSVFQRLSTSWGDQMGIVLQNAILAFLENSRGGTLADLRRLLIEPGYRAEILKSVHDPNVLYYWQKVFPQLSGAKSIGPVLTRLEMLLAKKPIAHMVSQSENRLDFANIMDTGKIFLAKLPEGLLGRENSHLLGALLLAKFQQLVMSRQAQQAASRKPFWIYADEAANFMTPSMTEILSGARKYRIGLTLAHHELHQLRADPNIESAVMSHPFTRVVFRVGDEDARKLAEGFSLFEATDLRNLETGQAIVRVERSDYDFNLTVPLPTEPSAEEAAQRRQAVIESSRKKYATPRADVEAILRKGLEIEAPKAAAKVPEPKAAPPVPPPVPTPSPPRATAASRPAATADLGRGGEQHQAIQLRLKQAAEGLGFRATIEKPILDGQGSVDLLLERAETVIACEISVTNTIDYEVGNVRKCVKAGFSHIVVVCVDKERLRKIATALTGSLGLDASKRVIFLQPDDFIAHLKAPAPSTPTPATPAQPEISHGYRIKRTHAKLSPGELKAREDAALKTITEAMRRKRKK